MSQLREQRWQEITQGNARYSWMVVRTLQSQGIDDVPRPHVPARNADVDDLKKAERTFQKAIEFCQKCSPYEWRTQYGVTNTDSIVNQLSRALDTIQKEQQRLKREAEQRDPGPDPDHLALTVVR